MQIINNLRATINEGNNINQGRDFSDLGAGNVTNSNGFSDTIDDLSLTTSATAFILNKGHCFVRYEKAGQFAFMKCELLQNYTSPLRTGIEYIYVQLVNNLLVSGSTKNDGSDYFTIEFASSLPTGNLDYIYPLYLVDWDSGATPTITDLRIKRDVSFRNIEVNNIEANNIVATSLTLPSGNVQNQLDTINNQFTTFGGADFVDVELGEDIVAGNKKGAVFFGKGITSTVKQEQIDQGTHLNFGSADTNAKIGIYFKTPAVGVGVFTADILQTARIQLRNIGNPEGNVLINLFDQTKTITVPGFITQIISVSNFNSIYSNGDLFNSIDMGNVQIQPNTHYFLELSRDVAFDSINYLQLAVSQNNNNSDFWYSEYQASINTWTDNSNDPFIILQYAHKYDKGKVYLSNPDYKGTSICDGIITQSGLTGETRAMQMRGWRNESVVAGENYFLSKHADHREQGYKNISGKSIVLNWEKKQGGGGGTVILYDNKYYHSYTPQIDLMLIGVKFFIDFISYQPNSAGHQIKIHPDNGGLPDTSTDLASNNQFLSGTSGQDIEVINNITHPLLAGVTYWIGFYPIAGGADTINLRGTTKISPYSNFAYEQAGAANPPVALTLDTGRNLHYELLFQEPESVNISDFEGIIAKPTAENGVYGTYITGEHSTRHIGKADTEQRLRVLIEEANSDYEYSGIEYPNHDNGFNGAYYHINDTSFQKIVYVEENLLINLRIQLSVGGFHNTSSSFTIEHSNTGKEFSIVYIRELTSFPVLNTSIDEKHTTILKRGYYRLTLNKVGAVTDGSFETIGFNTIISKL